MALLTVRYADGTERSAELGGWSVVAVGERRRFAGGLFASGTMSLPLLSGLRFEGADLWAELREGSAIVTGTFERVVSPKGLTVEMPGAGPVVLPLADAASVVICE